MAKNPSETSEQPSFGSKAGFHKTSIHQGETAADSRDQLIAELRAAVCARDDFLAVAAHELRNPLTPILLCLELVRGAQQSGNDGKLRSELDRLERLIKHFVGRTNMLLEVAQITSDKFHLESVKLDLSNLIESIVDDYMPLTLRAGSVLTANIQQGVVAHLDALASSQIVENLLSNAIKYGDHKPIDLSLTANDALAQIVVRDNGIGIDDKDRDRIFGRFERAVSSEGRSGFGIGLWLTRNLVESMGGTIAVIGKPGAGSLFTVTLPIKARENQ
jgi:signal transduction histidine kinase